MQVAGLTVAFREGERLHVEDSWKYDLFDFLRRAERAGVEALETWTDPACLFSVHLLAAPSLCGRVAA